jgi:hypothetical protein
MIIWSAILNAPKTTKLVDGMRFWTLIQRRSRKLAWILGTTFRMKCEWKFFGMFIGVESLVDIHYPKNEWFSNVMNEEDNGFRARQISYGSKLIVCYSACANNRERMRIWKMGNPPILLQDRIFEDRNLRIAKVDERFIFATKSRQIAINGALFYKSPTLYFISTGTLEEFRALSVTNYEWTYDRGLFFNSVTTGSFV